jgi:hypothetical protein
VFDERLVVLLFIALPVCEHEVARIVFAASREWNHVIDLAECRASDRFATARAQSILLAKQLSLDGVVERDARPFARLSALLITGTATILVSSFVLL